MDFEDTEELEYSLDLSSTGEENLEDSESSSDGDSLPDANLLKPFDFEPACPLRHDISMSSSSSSVSSDEYNRENISRAGKTDWCLCGKCRAMETDIESLCCCETNEVPDDYFEGKTCKKLTLLEWCALQNQF